MTYPASIEDKLGFTDLRTRLMDLSRSALGVEQVERMTFSDNPGRLKTELGRVNEFKSILSAQSLPEIKAFHDLKALQEQGRLPGSFLPAEAFVQIRDTIDAAKALSDLFKSAKEETTLLSQLTTRLIIDAELIRQIDGVIDEKGKVKDNASPELQQIRRAMHKEEGRLRGIVNASYKKAQKDGLVPEGSTISVRDGRMVIPLEATHKRQVSGFIHDESASGHIVYLEPTEALEANNQIKELYYAEQREIVRLLTNLTDAFRTRLESVGITQEFLAEVDFIWSKAQLAILLDASLPTITNSDAFEIKNARHPQLIKSFAGTDRVVVAQDFHFDKEHRIVLISGPNAGGKSVALKTMGICQYMLQCGLLPCASEESIFRIFENLFVDIGDEQSIENDLSTYSSHLQNMRISLKGSDSNSLVLIDEFGTGTDPQFGAAIAESMLQQFLIKSCYALITTHYGNLKSFAEKHEGCANAAMRFDMVNLEPLFILDFGRPGSSFALEIAQKTGIPGEVIKAAKELVGYDQISTEKLLNKLERQKQTLETRARKLKEQEKESAQTKEKYEHLKSTLDSQKSDIIDKAKQEASSILATTNKEIEKTIRHIKENKAHKEETKKVRGSLSDFARKVEVPKNKKAKVSHEVVGGPLAAGDFAILKNSGVLVEIQEVKGKSAKVLMGELLSIVKLKDLTKVSNKQAKKQHRTGISSQSLDLNKKMAHFSSTLDIRGRRAEEVLVELASFLDHALMLSQTDLKVIHGKGTGALRQVVRNHLKEYNFIKSVTSEHVDRGGDGVTLIALK